MEKPMGAMGLRDAHDAINIALKDRISDWDKVETAMTKTEEGYVWEIRYKDMKLGHPWRAELPVDQEALTRIVSEAKGNSTTSPL